MKPIPLVSYWLSLRDWICWNKKFIILEKLADVQWMKNGGILAIPSVRWHRVTCYRGWIGWIGGESWLIFCHTIHPWQHCESLCLCSSRYIFMCFLKLTGVSKASCVYSYWFCWFCKVFDIPWKSPTTSQVTAVGHQSLWNSQQSIAK